MYSNLNPFQSKPDMQSEVDSRKPPLVQLSTKVGAFSLAGLSAAVVAGATTGDPIWIEIAGVILAAISSILGIIKNE